MNLVGPLSGGQRWTCHARSGGRGEAYCATRLALISNGNVREYSDLAQNQALTSDTGYHECRGVVGQPRFVRAARSATFKGYPSSEYLDLVDLYPVKLKSVIFHIRRMCKEKFNSYQLMEECVQSKSIQEALQWVLLTKV